MNPKVSVVITCYNYAQYVAGALDCALSQTYSNLEIIVVNDGSTDDTDAVIQPYLSEARVRYIHQSNSGQAHAKNVGAQKATGTWIAFLDADDRWQRNKLERQSQFFQDPKVGVIFSRMSILNDSEQEVLLSQDHPHFRPRSGAVTNFLIFDNFIPFSSSVVRKTLFDQVGGFDESLAMGIDWDLWLKLSVLTEFKFVDEALLKYRQGHTGQMSRNLEKRAECSDRILDRFVMEHPNLIPTGTLQEVRAYTYSNRAYYYRPLDLKKSTYFYRLALREKWTHFYAVRGLVKNIFLSVFG